MNLVQIPPDGIPAEFTFEIPAPADLDSLGGVRLYFVFTGNRPDTFVPRLVLDGESRVLTASAMGPASLTFVAQLPDAVPAPAQAQVVMNEAGHLEPGTEVTVYAWGAQTKSGTGALNPDEGGEPSSTTDTIEVGQIQVLPWLEWNRLTGANQGEQSGS